jgi:hypothetical protein
MPPHLISDECEVRLRIADSFLKKLFESKRIPMYLSYKFPLIPVEVREDISSESCLTTYMEIRRGRVVALQHLVTPDAMTPDEFKSGLGFAICIAHRQAASYCDLSRRRPHRGLDDLTTEEHLAHFSDENQHLPHYFLVHLALSTANTKLSPRLRQMLKQRCRGKTYKELTSEFGFDRNRIAVMIQEACFTVGVSIARAVPFDFDPLLVEGAVTYAYKQRKR